MHNTPAEQRPCVTGSLVPGMTVPHQSQPDVSYESQGVGACVCVCDCGYLQEDIQVVRPKHLATTGLSRLLSYQLVQKGTIVLLRG